jgi:hypothetical protein
MSWLRAGAYEITFAGKHYFSEIFLTRLNEIVLILTS